MQTLSDLGLSPEEASELLSKWRKTPQSYFHEVLGVEEIWDLQDQLLSAIPRAIEEHKHVYIGSGHALGKDFICGGLPLWFNHCYPRSVAIMTAPTDRQVKKIMWGEMLAHWKRRKLDLGGVPYANPYFEIQKEDWYTIGFTTKETGASKEAAGGKFQGFHSAHMCIIVSEAQAVEDTIYDQIDGVATSENVLVIFIGNPTRAKGRFAKGLRDKENNIVFNFSCLENPNYIHKKEVIPGLAAYHWVEDKRKRWGVTDPRWFGRVLGQIPDTAISTVIGESDIAQMKAKHGCLLLYGTNGGVAVDPAGEGVDFNEFIAGRNGEKIKTISQTSMAPSVQAITAVELCKEIHGNFIIVDCDGLGIGCWQELNKLSRKYLEGIVIIKFHGSAPSLLEEDGHKIYQNMRAEAAFANQKRAREGKAAIDKEDAECIEDLKEEEYFENNRGLIQIEDKNDIKERLERSPGKGDSFKMLQWAFDQDYKKLDYSPVVDRQGQGELVTAEMKHPRVSGY